MVYAHKSERVWRDLEKLLDVVYDLAYFIIICEKVLSFDKDFNETEGQIPQYLWRLSSGVVWKGFKTFHTMRRLCDVIFMKFDDPRLRTQKNDRGDQREKVISKIRKVCIFLLCITTGVTLFGYVVFQIRFPNMTCVNEFGDEKLWSKSSPRILFRNGLFSKPSCAFDLVESLDLSNLNLKELPSKVSLLSNLMYLDLSGNQLQSLPLTLNPLGRLETLDLDGNPVEKSLSFAHSSLKEIPYFLGLMTSLNVLNLSFNELVDLKRDGKHILSNITYLNSLDLSYNRFPSVSLESLVLNRNLKHLNF